MEPTYLFLDTEWADMEGVALVSLALVSADERAQFYAERDPLPLAPTEFVRDFVYPLLERGLAARVDADFVDALRSFLGSIPNPMVIYDYPNDLSLLRAAIGGFGLVPSELADCAAPPRNLSTSLVDDPLVGDILEDWFSASPADAARRHHALVDAKALRIAWLAASGRLDAPWSSSWSRTRRGDAAGRVT